MCLAVVAVAAMSVVGRGSATATVEEAATAAAEEADDGPEIRKLHPGTRKLGFTSPRVNKHIASEKGVPAKKERVPSQSVPLFLEERNVCT
jgi:hypothetical protein